MLIDEIMHAQVLIDLYERVFVDTYNMWQSQVENEHYSRLIRLVISLECSIEITPDFLCPFMND